MSIDHYENFPVASILLPKALRPAVKDIYAFARSADDIADEGEYTDSERINALRQYEEALNCLTNATPLAENIAHLRPIFEPLAHTVQHHNLLLQPFYDLLSAFKQDVSVKRYESFSCLLDYSARSADPVGRLLLRLYDADTPQNLTWSDAICSALQFANFWQDVAIDWQKDRVYIPQDALHAHQLNDSFIANCVEHRQSCIQPAWQALMRSLCHDARDRLLFGAPLVSQLSGRIALELKFIILGGLRILERIEDVNFDVFTQRPTLTKKDWALLLVRALKPLPRT